MKRLSVVLSLSLLASLLLPMAFAQQTELRVSWWGSQNRHDRTIQVIQMFEELNPDVKIIFEPAGWADYWVRMNTQAAGGNLPDIMQHDYAFLAEWASRGLIVPLNPFMGSVIDTTYISDAALEGGMIGDSLYAINLGTNSQNFIIDVDAFERAGIPLPSPDWTWAEFEETALALHEALGIWAIGPGLYGDQMWKGLYLGYEQWAYNDEGTDLGYEDDQPFVDYLKMIQRLMDAGAVPTRAEDIAEFDGQSVEALPVVSGRSVMDSFWSNQIIAVWGAAGEDRNFKLWHLPRTEGGQSQNYLKPSQFFSITKDAKDPELAARFIDFFSNSIEANEILLAERGVPISGAVQAALVPLLTPAQIEMFEYIARVEQDNSPIRPPDPPGHSDIVNNVYMPIILDQVFYGQITPERAVQALRQEATRILRQNR